MLSLKRFIFVFIKEWINVKLSWKIENIIYFVKLTFLFIKNDSIDLKE
jgi:hypothetical protein